MSKKKSKKKVREIKSSIKEIKKEPEELEEEVAETFEPSEENFETFMSAGEESAPVLMPAESQEEEAEDIEEIAETAPSSPPLTPTNISYDEVSYNPQNYSTMEEQIEEREKARETPPPVSPVLEDTGITAVEFAENIGRQEARRMNHPSQAEIEGYKPRQPLQVREEPKTLPFEKKRKRRIL